jgi:hypothetical protein
MKSFNILIWITFSVYMMVMYWNLVIFWCLSIHTKVCFVETMYLIYIPKNVRISKAIKGFQFKTQDTLEIENMN